MNNWVKKITNFLNEVKQEMKKVTWLSRRELFRYTLLVIGISFIVAAILGGLDNIFRYLLFSFIF
jgi:preprotein translocase subunit SecE